MKKKYITLLISALVCGQAYAETETLEEISVTAEKKSYAGSATTDYLKVSDNVIDGRKLKSRSATLGNALAGELSVHSNPFGGGASAPIIRGQEGFRVKILQNGSDVVDMSSISPDHAVSADSLLAKQIELVRGSSTLLYSTASPAGVVNVVDKRIPTEVPQKGYEGDINFRFDTASKERSTIAGLTFGLGQHVAMHVEGLARRSDNYKVPGINLGHTINYVPDTHNKSQVGTIGFSLIGDAGYIGASYNQRNDVYGLPGHNHKFDNCSGHITDPGGGTTLGYRIIPRNYLLAYPHLMDDTDVIDSPHFHCTGDHSHDAALSHDNPFGYEHNHNHKGPWIELHSKRWDLRGQWNQPVTGIDKLRISGAYVDYHHDEKDESEKFGSTQNAVVGMPIDGKAAAYFKNKGVNLRFELDHAPLGGLTGTWGVQYQTQKSSAYIPSERNLGERYPLVPHTNKQISFFGVEQYRWNDFIFELGMRTEKQSTPVHYDFERLAPYLKGNVDQPDLTTYKESAFSYSSSVEWLFDDVHRLSFMYSHNERLPSPMELYYHGKHLATSSFMFGNKNLTKEQSDNFEIGIARETGKLDYKLSLYHNKFDNYIHNENLWREGNLFMRRYTQSKAKFYGAEGEISYSFVPEHKITLFGDVITGKVSNLPKIIGRKITERVLIPKVCTEEDLILAEFEEDPYEVCHNNQAYQYEVTGYETIVKPNRYSPRLPPMRLGIRMNSQFGDNWSAFAEYTHVFKQEKVAISVSSKRNKATDEEQDPPLLPVYIKENVTKGYHLVNLGVDYNNKWNNVDYKISLNANNLLNEKIHIHTSYLQFVPQMGRNFVLGLNVSF